MGDVFGVGIVDYLLCDDIKFVDQLDINEDILLKYNGGVFEEEDEEDDFMKMISV